nr:hypothetical protein [Tanacetum cinerariifolium]
MRTRSQSRNNFPQQKASPAIVEPLRIEFPFLEDQFQEDLPKDPPKVPMADNRTMAELLQAPTEGYEDAIAVVAKVSTSSSTPAVLSEVAELKDLVRALLLDKKNQSSAPTQSLTPAPVKAVELNYVTCGGLLISVLLFTVCEEASKVESCPSEIILDDLLALDSIVRFDLGDRRLEQTATFSISTNSE